MRYFYYFTIPHDKLQESLVPFPLPGYTVKKGSAEASLMTIKEVNYPSTGGQAAIHGALFIPEEQPRAVIQLVHGMSEYILRYTPMAEALCAMGYAVCGEDHLGHGQSLIDGVPGYFGKKGAYRTVVEDVHYMTLLAKAEFPGLPVFLLGHSMGSFLSRYYATVYAGDIAGLILSGTGGTNPLAGIGGAVCSVIGFFKGERSYSKILEKLSTGDFNSHFSEDATGTDWLTRDEEEQRKYREDEHCGIPFKAGGYRELSYLVKAVSGHQWAEKMPKELPVFLYSGDKDPVGGFGKGVSEVYDLLQSAGVRDVTLTLYADGRHEMHHELNRDEVFAGIESWVDAHLPKEKTVRAD